MLGKIVLPVEFCNRHTLKSKRLNLIASNLEAHGDLETAKLLRRRHNPLTSLLKQCQIVGGQYQRPFGHEGEMIFHPIHPYLYCKREHLKILRLFEGDIAEYPISTMQPVKGLEASSIIPLEDGELLHWSIATKLSLLDNLLFGESQGRVLLPGDIAKEYGVEIFDETKTVSLV